ncbi:hypothetical protein B6U99_05335 [Candidatus Geothermarchaeota archaeon ex4572_27]|nr:MAG: hypothetical protein B6U99_05335 [Candidatus Geothermarchaeota archaeon ex4572_27]
MSALSLLLVILGLAFLALADYYMVKAPKQFLAERHVIGAVLSLSAACGMLLSAWLLASIGG